MIYHAENLKQLKNAIDSYIKILGENGIVGIKYIDSFRVSEFVTDGVVLDYVFINQDTGHVVGTEAEDYKPKENEIPSIRIS